VRRLSEPAGPYRNQDPRFSSQDAVCTRPSAYPSTSSGHRLASVLATNCVSAANKTLFGGEPVTKELRRSRTAWSGARIRIHRRVRRQSGDPRAIGVHDVDLTIAAASGSENNTLSPIHPGGIPI
jgi:hypothetical protein